MTAVWNITGQGLRRNSIQDQKFELDDDAHEFLSLLLVCLVYFSSSLFLSSCLIVPGVGVAFGIYHSSSVAHVDIAKSIAYCS